MHWEKDCNGMGAPIDLENVNSLCEFVLYANIFRFIFNLRGQLFFLKDLSYQVEFFL